MSVGRCWRERSCSSSSASPSRGSWAGPLLVADEAGYLTNARVLTGGVPGQMTIAPFYRGGYSLLLAPLISLGWSSSVTYHLILALNALLAASLVPLLYLLLTRAMRVPPQAAIAGAVVGAAYPSVTLLSQVAMSENLLAPLFVVWLLAAAMLADAVSNRALPLGRSRSLRAGSRSLPPTAG